MESWVYLGATSTYYDIFSTASGGDNQGIIFYCDGSAGEIKAKIGDGSSWTVQITSAEDVFTANAWHHVALVREGTGSNELKIYLDGTSVAQGTYADSDADNNTNLFRVGYWSPSSWYWNGYMDEVRVSNVARYTTTFTPQRTQFTADANTKLLIHSDYTGGLGADSSGNFNNFTATNLVATDQMIDTPTNNFCTLNPIVLVPGTGWNGSEGNLSFTRGSDDAWGTVTSTMAPGSGKWYFEGLLVSTSGSVNTGIGIAGTNANDVWRGSTNGTYDIATVKYDNAGTVSMDGSALSPNPYGATYAAGDIIGVVYDMDASPRTCTFYKNNTIVNAAFDLSSNFTASAGIAPLLHVWGREKWTMNFGQDSSFAGAKTAQGNTDSGGVGDFYYEPPSGLALCTDNLPDPQIALPGEHFNTVLWSGVDAANSITGVGFQPDTLWFKARNNSSNHRIQDVLRGATNAIYPNDAAAQSGSSDTNLNSFDADGFSMNQSPQSGGMGNYASDTYAGWNWKAGGAGVANTTGSIDSTVSANATSGFSIVTYTGEDNAGDTVGHGLSQAPELIIVKDLTTAEDWQAYDAIGGPTKYLQLNDSGPYATDTTRWNDTAPTSTVFSLGTSDKVNDAGDSYVAYCFHSVEGYSKIFGYKGNGTDGDGNFLYCGFRPRYVMFKETSATNGWAIIDNKCNPYNLADQVLVANNNSATYSHASGVDLLSNGIKLVNNNGMWNDNNADYIFYAIADTPFKTANAR